MQIGVILSSLNGWANNLLGSPYLYIAMGGVFTIIFVYALWRLLRKSPSQPVLSVKAAQTNGAGQTPPSGDVENCAHRVAEAIAKLNGTTKSVLLAGAGLESLPITISVKSAIQLAQAGKKCILIDLDTRRNAAAKVFDIHSDNIKTPCPKPIPTVIENLSLWPAEFFVRFARMNLQHIVQSSVANYDIILINAPYLDGHPDRKLIASSANYGLIFCRKPKQLERLTDLLKNNNCVLLPPRPANQ